MGNIHHITTNPGNQCLLPMRSLNKFLTLLFLTGFLLGSCNNFHHNPFLLVSDYSGIKFDESNLKLIEFENPGYKENLREGLNIALFEMKDINLNSLGVELSSLNYKRLPIPDISLAAKYARNLSLSDKGYYKQDLNKNGFEIEKIIIINFTKKRVIYYELW